MAGSAAPCLRKAMPAQPAPPCYPAILARAIPPTGHLRASPVPIQTRRKPITRPSSAPSSPGDSQRSTVFSVVMTEDSAEQVREKVDAVYRSESRRIFATLIRLLGDLELAEDALHDAFSAALEQWPKEGVPANPRAWLVSAGRFKAIDAMRRRVRFDAAQAAIAEQFGAETHDTATFDDESMEDDRL